MPKSIESFYQEIGRAGRDGAPADTILFYSLADIIQLEKFAKDSGQKETNMEKLRRMSEYAESNVCRRRILLNYFGEQTDHDCGNCDVCENPPQRFDGTRHVQMALSAVKRTHEQTRVSTVIEILKGMRSPTVISKGYHNLPTFGVGRNLSTKEWQDYILQMLQMGFIEIAYDEGNAVKTTALGEEVLYGRKTAELCVLEKKSGKAEKTTKQRKLHLEIPAPPIPGMPAMQPTEEPVIFEALRRLRTNISSKENIPPYIVFSDKVLHSLATIKPTTIEEFGQVSGIGEFKKEKYGTMFVGLIKRILQNGSVD